MTGNSRRPARGPDERHDPGHVREAYAVAACKGLQCGSGIRWVPSYAGPHVPLDHGRTAAGAVVLDQHRKNDQVLWVARPFVPGKDDPGRPRYDVHWSTCRDAGLYREVKRRADPRVVFPPLARTATTDNLGPCTRCGKTCHRYGLGGSPLCPDCGQEAVARWSPAFRAGQKVHELPGDR